MFAVYIQGITLKMSEIYARYTLLRGKLVLINFVGQCVAFIVIF